MHKYKVINFSGVPYGKPDEMQKGRESYIVRQLLKTDDIWHPKLDNKYQEVFKVIPIGHQQLKVLHTLLMSASNTPLDAFHCEQVIGRVLRILNRPRSPDIQQMISYNANLDETIKLAQDLSRNGVNWRKVGQFLTGLACCAVLASGVAFFFVSAQVSLALLGIDTFLSAAAWFLKKCRKVTIEDSVTNFVCNVKRFSPSYKTIFKFDDHYYFNDEPNGPLPNEPIYAMNKILDTLNKYVPDSIILPKFQSIYNISYKDLLAVSLQRRVIDGDDFSELVQQLNDIPKCNNIDHFKHVAAISGLTMLVNENSTFSMISTSELYDLTHLDPLGSDNPAEAIQQAAVEYYKNQSKLCEELQEKTLVQQAYQTLSGWGNLLFGSTKSQSNSVNTLIDTPQREAIETPQTEALQLCLAYG